MANPTIPNYGGVDYVNDVNNWRAEDIQFLEGRTVLRYPTSADLESDSNHNLVGALAYVADDSSSPDPDDPVTPGNDPHIRARLDSKWRRVAVSEHLRVPIANDTSSAVLLRHASASSGISLTSSGDVNLDRGIFLGSRASLTQGGVLTLSTGSTSAAISVVGSLLNVSTPLRATSIQSIGAITGGTGPHTLGGSLSLSSGSFTASSGTIATFSSTAITSGTGNFTTLDGASIRTSGLIFSGGQITSRVNSFSKINLSTDLTIEAANLKFRHAPGQTMADVAGVVTSGSAPTPGDVYPNGTIWVQV